MTAIASSEQTCDDIDEVFAWYCYTNSYKDVSQHRSLSELCEAHGVDYKDARYAVKYNNGIYGAFHIVRKY